MEIYYDERYKYPSSAMLNITDDCNLACKYCFVQQYPHYMDIEIAKQAIDFLENNYNIKKEKNILFKDEKILITFFGGEPTLLFDKIIIPLIKYIEEFKQYDNYNFSITTNCTLLTEEKIKFLKKHNFSILFSIDGDEETQNYNRPCKDHTLKSFDLIKKNIPYLLQYFPNATFRSTIYKDTVKNLYQNYLFAKSQGFKSYCAIPDTRSMNWDKNDLIILEQQTNLICLDQIKEYLKNDNFSNFMVFDNLTKMIKLIPKQDLFTTHISSADLKIMKNTIDRCGLGTTGISINYIGDIFSCQEQDSRKYGEYFHIGNIIDGININKHKQLLNEYYNSEIICEKENFCNECYLKNICNKGCPSTQKDMFNNMGKMAYVRCFYDNLVMINAILAFNILSNKDPDFINKIINDNIPSVLYFQKKGVK